MHMGAMVVIGANLPKNMVHIIINNGAHETVDRIPTVASKIDFVVLAKACGYSYTVCVDNFEDLDKELEAAKSRKGLSLVEARSLVGLRADLGRPSTTALENKQNFIKFIH